MEAQTRRKHTESSHVPQSAFSPPSTARLRKTVTPQIHDRGRSQSELRQTTQTFHRNSDEVPRTPPASPLNLPDEILLNICEQLSPYDLWLHARLISKSFYACAEEIFKRKYLESFTQLSWCCLWCSHGPISLRDIFNALEPVLDPKTLRAQVEANDIVVMALFYGFFCKEQVVQDQWVTLRIGQELSVNIKAKYLLRRARNAHSNPREHSYRFLTYCFAAARNAKKRWRITSGMLWMARHISYILTIILGTALFGISMGVLLSLEFLLAFFEVVTWLFRAMVGIVQH
jgi:uncharacterized MAPEG superfamily protein